VIIGGVGVLKRLSITSALGGLVGWLVGWYSFYVWLMRIKSTISPPEGHIRRAKLWDYSADTLP
jgi:hypothetical protein